MTASNHRQRGVGLIEVLIAAAVLAVATAGIVVLLSDWFQSMADSARRTDALMRASSVMEIARYRPTDTTWVSAEVAGMEMGSSRGSFTVTDLTIVDGVGSDTFSATIQWTDPYLDGADKTRSFGFSSSVSDDVEYQGLAGLVTPGLTLLTVNTSPSVGTAISPGTRSVTAGSVVGFSVGITDAQRYTNLSVTGCGGTLSGSVYTTGAITANCTVSAFATLIDADNDGVADIDDLCADTVTGIGAGVDATGCLLLTNIAPVALDDFAETEQDIPVTIAVLYNDTDPNLDILSVVLEGQPSYGSAAVVGTNVVYTPLTGWVGTDTFTYQASDGLLTSQATVTVNVLRRNQPPVPVADAGTVTEDGPLATTIDVTANDSDPDGDILTVTSGPYRGNYGIFELNGNNVTYSLDNANTTVQALDTGDTLTDSYTYRIEDGFGGSATEALTITIQGIHEPWQATVTFSPSGTGNHSYSYVVGDYCVGIDLSGTQTCTFFSTQGVEDITVGITTNSYLCSYSPAVVSLTPDSPAATVSLVLANNANQCPL